MGTAEASAPLSPVMAESAVPPSAGRPKAATVASAAPSRPGAARIVPAIACVRRSRQHEIVEHQRLVTWRLGTRTGSCSSSRPARSPPSSRSGSAATRLRRLNSAMGRGARPTTRQCLRDTPARAPAVASADAIAQSSTTARVSVPRAMWLCSSENREVAWPRASDRPLNCQQNTGPLEDQSRLMRRGGPLLKACYQEGTQLGSHSNSSGRWVYASTKMANWCWLQPEAPAAAHSIPQSCTERARSTRPLQVTQLAGSAPVGAREGRPTHCCKAASLSACK